jgi:hypothetical protein
VDAVIDEVGMIYAWLRCRDVFDRQVREVRYTCYVLFEERVGSCLTAWCFRVWHLDVEYDRVDGISGRPWFDQVVLLVWEIIGILRT